MDSAEKDTLSHFTRAAGRGIPQSAFGQVTRSIIRLAFTGGTAIQNVTRVQQSPGSIDYAPYRNVVAFIVAASKNNCRSSNRDLQLRTSEAI